MKKFLEGLKSLSEKEKLQICASGLMMRSLFAKKVRDNAYGLEDCKKNKTSAPLQEDQKEHKGKRNGKQGDLFFYCMHVGLIVGIASLGLLA